MTYNNNNNYPWIYLGMAALMIYVVTASESNSLQWRRQSDFASIQRQRQNHYHHPSLPPRFQIVEASLPKTQEEVNTMETRQQRFNSIWPPWPFNLLSTRKNNNNNHNNNDKIYHRSGWNRVWYASKASLKVAARNTQQITSSLYMHLPPAAHPFLLLASIPQGLIKNNNNNHWKVPLFTDPFARYIGFAAVGIAIVSWAHCDWYRRRSLTPLPLVEQYRDIHRAILPPFLPDEVNRIVQPTTTTSSWLDTNISNPDSSSTSFQFEQRQQTTTTTTTTTGSAHEKNSQRNTSRLALPRIQIQNFWNTRISTSNHDKKVSPKWNFRLDQWRERCNYRHLQRLQERRRVIYDELVALQTLKQKQNISLLQKFKRTIGKSKLKGQVHHQQQQDTEEEPLGYALVTGASGGIGRAIAVELARWEIPLILVARNMDRLISLAYDLENCYGVKCCVLEADLAQPGIAQRVYQTTQEAGLRVDILVNNAGVSSHGIAVDQPIDEVNDMLQLNACSTTILSHLFGQDMKKRRRGRILFVSSISGAVAGVSTVALYSATKAFQNSLSIAMTKEMEPHGVGVTCLMPGAVQGTDFAKKSQTDQALCWKLPLYPKKPQMIAKIGVRAMLQGESEVIPGWQNRVFVKVLKPILPQRLHNVIAEIVWNPLQLPFAKSQHSKSDTIESSVRSELLISPPSHPNEGSSRHVFTQFGSERLPRLLQLKQEGEEKVDEQHLEEDSGSHNQDETTSMLESDPSSCDGESSH